MKKIVDKKKLALISVRKAKSLLNKIELMINNDEYCIDILIQMLAVEGLIKSSTEKILVAHLKTCFMDGIECTESTKKMKYINEVIDVMGLSRKA